MRVNAEFIAQLIATARAAGDAILRIYHAAEQTKVELKGDGSPVTAADLAAHHLIVAALAQLLPVPIVSEEAELPPFSERRRWQRYWLIDPLDGTKEFIQRNGEFTVNIALVEAGVPVFGVVHIPVSDETYLGVDKSLSPDSLPLAEKYIAGNKVATLQTRSLAQRLASRETLDVLVSHRHGGHATEDLLQNLQARWPAPLQYLKAGSSLKFCWLAEGRADFYPRLAPTSEWDTAAAQAVLVAAGGMVMNAEDFRELRCNRGESLLNPWFLAVADKDADWQKLLGFQAR